MDGRYSREQLAISVVAEPLGAAVRHHVFIQFGIEQLVGRGIPTPTPNNPARVRTRTRVAGFARRMPKSMSVAQFVRHNVQTFFAVARGEEPNADSTP